MGGIMARGLLTDRVALVTGAGQGLGRAIAVEFAAEGAVTALIDRNPETLEETRLIIEKARGHALTYTLDITDYTLFRKVVATVIEEATRIDILVNNAAIARYGTILEDALDDWRAQIAVNLEAVYMGTKLTVPQMVAQGFGRIVSIASIEGIASGGHSGAYTAAKGGIIAFTKSLAVELAPHGIAANAIAPGFIRTPMSIIDGVDETTTDAFQEWYVSRAKIPLARAGCPEDVAGAAVFLASDYCRYMTGQVLVVDGGLTSTF
jgi:NAD(P)-dependent dehydrogenase (short-subunit alcohol dehydrogenase family)